MFVPRVLQALALTAITFGSAGLACAADMSLSGNFNTDDQVDYFSMTVGSTSTVTLETLSYGGSMMPSVPSGGFPTIITLFSSTGMFIDSSSNTGVSCMTGQQADMGVCADAYVSDTLAAGTYYAALTEYPNGAIGNTSDGFLFAGQGDFTGGPNGLCPAGGPAFNDSTTVACAQRNSSFNLVASGTGLSSVMAVNTAPGETPEPATLLLTAPVLGWLVYKRRSRKALEV